MWSRRVGVEEKWELREGIYREEVKESVQNRRKIEFSVAVVGCLPSSTDQVGRYSRRLGITM